MTTLLAAVLALAPQETVDQRIDALLAGLADDRIEARDQAVEALAALGAKALPALRARLSTLDGEVRGRVEEACRRIESREMLARTLPPLRTVTAEFVDVPARAALEEVGRRAGIRLDLGAVESAGKVTLSLKDVSPLRALDEVARRAGLSYSVQQTPEAGAAAEGADVALFDSEPEPVYPSTYLRHYRVRCTDVTLVRSNRFRDVERSASLALELHWPPGVHPAGVHSFVLTDVRDDADRLLVLPADPDGLFRRGFHWSPSLRFLQEEMPFKFPEEGVKAIRAKGSVVLVYPQDVVKLAIDAPAAALGKPFDVGGMKITLDQFQTGGQEHNMMFTIEGRPRGVRVLPLEENNPSEGVLPFGPEDIEAVTADHEPLLDNGTVSGTRDHLVIYGIRRTSRKSTTIKSIRVRCVSRYHEDVLEFELSGIELPR